MLFKIAGYIHGSDGDAGMRILRNSRAAIIVTYATIWGRTELPLIFRPYACCSRSRHLINCLFYFRKHRYFGTSAVVAGLNLFPFGPGISLAP